MNETYIFKSDGTYLGFIKGELIYSRDGFYLGWLEGVFAWGADGSFRGQLYKINNHNYIFANRFAMPPIPKSPKLAPSTSITPAPPANIVPISLPLGFENGF